MAASVAQHHAGPQLLLRRPSSCSVTETLQTPQPTATATMAGESPLIRSQPSQVRLEQQAATPLTPGPGAGSTEPAADTPTPCPHYTDLSVDHRARLASTPSWLPLLGLALGTCAAGSDAAPMFQAPDRLMEGDISGSSGMYGAHLLQLLTEHLRTLFQRFADRQLTRDELIRVKLEMYPTHEEYLRNQQFYNIIGYFGQTFLEVPSTFVWLDEQQQVRCHANSMMIELALELGEATYTVTDEFGVQYEIHLGAAEIGPSGFYFRQQCLASGAWQALTYQPTPARPPLQHPNEVLHRLQVLTMPLTQPLSANGTTELVDPLSSEYQFLAAHFNASAAPRYQLCEIRKRTEARKRKKKKEERKRKKNEKDRSK